MTNSQILLIVKVAETGSFTKAGEALNMTQPAVSRSISTLESELGVTLFIRDKKQGILLTDIGRRLLLLFREILNNYERVEQEVQAELGYEIGTIRIGAFPIISAYFLPSIIKAIGEKYPQIKYELYEGNVDEIKEWLASRFIDVGWIIPPNEPFDALPFYRDEMCLLIRDDHPLHNRTPIHITDLHNEPLILCKGGFELPVYELFQRYDTVLNEAFELHNVNAAIRMVQEGLGTAIVSNISLSLSALPPNVRIRSLEPAPYRDIQLAVPSLADASNAVKLFIRIAQELFVQQNGHSAI
ncbi:LysR family transcriptional regulator [Paenibacillaceae bacterium WGS1546]|uniref:LysR family transcriptional regulator n=1 Tax=Cohnella sp. WGS1546 TaxID=3366810 RepID=UPI00372D57B0